MASAIVISVVVRSVMGAMAAVPRSLLRTSSTIRAIVASRPKMPTPSAQPAATSDQ